jgi:hypothetical protein
MRMSVDTCADLALKELSSGVAERFAREPAETLRENLGLAVQCVGHLDQSRDDGGVCDGLSYLSDGVVLYRRTGNRRENFTLAHELGHWLVDLIEDIYDWLVKQSNPAKMLETVCDRIAQKLLLPNTVSPAFYRANE